MLCGRQLRECEHKQSEKPEEGISWPEDVIQGPVGQDRCSRGRRRDQDCGRPSSSALVGLELGVGLGCSRGGSVPRSCFVEERKVRWGFMLLFYGTPFVVMDLVRSKL